MVLAVAVIMSIIDFDEQPVSQSFLVLKAFTKFASIIAAV